MKTPKITASGRVDPIKLAGIHRYLVQIYSADELANTSRVMSAIVDQFYDRVPDEFKSDDYELAFDYLESSRLLAIKDINARRDKQNALQFDSLKKAVDSGDLTIHTLETLLAKAKNQEKLPDDFLDEIIQVHNEVADKSAE